MVPVFVVVAFVVGGLLGTVLAHLVRWGEDAKMVVGLSLGGVLSVLAVVWSVRDYRRRSADRIEIREDRLEKVWGKRMEAYPLDELEWIEGPSLTTLTLKWYDGRKLRLRTEVWPVQEIGEALVSRAVPGMVRRMTERVARGEVVEFRPAAALLVRSVAAIVLGLGVPGLFLYQATMSKGFRFRGLGVTVVLAGAGLTALVQWGRTRGRILVESAGLRSRKQDPVVPWDDLWMDVRTEGLRLERGDGGKPIVLGSLARNYPVCVAFLSTRVQVAPPPGA